MKYSLRKLIILKREATKSRIETCSTASCSNTCSLCSLVCSRIKDVTGPEYLQTWPGENSVWASIMLSSDSSKISSWIYLESAGSLYDSTEAAAIRTFSFLCSFINLRSSCSPSTPQVRSTLAESCLSTCPSSNSDTIIGIPPASQTKVPIRLSNASSDYFCSTLAEVLFNWARIEGTKIILCIVRT